MKTVLCYVYMVSGNSVVIRVIRWITDMNSAFTEDLLERVHACKALVVGAGGIGCELVKNLVLAGFRTISLVGII